MKVEREPEGSYFTLKNGERSIVQLSTFSMEETEATNTIMEKWLELMRVSERILIRRDVSGVPMIYTRDGQTLLAMLPGDGGVSLNADGHFAARPAEENRPVRFVTWDGAQTLCKELGHRLPTEAEWQISAQGAERRTTPWAKQDEPPKCDGVVFARLKGQQCAVARSNGLQDVGTAKQDTTPDGIHDLAGSVAEWTYDQYVEHPNLDGLTDPVVEKTLPLSQDFRVIRGGSWTWPEQPMVTDVRRRMPRNEVRSDVGFRCVSSEAKLKIVALGGE